MRNLWGGMAEVLRAEPGLDDPKSMAVLLEGKDEVGIVVEKHALRPIPLGDILGEPHYYADFGFADGAAEPPPRAFSSRIKLQQAGLTGGHDTREAFNFWLRDLINH